MSKENFKSFVAKNPHLAKSVMNGKTTWQNLYEMYDLYGEQSEVWNEFKASDEDSSRDSTPGFKDLINTFKNLNMDNVQKNISSLQKAVDFLGDFTTGKAAKPNVVDKVYNPRPLNKFFDD